MSVAVERVITAGFGLALALFVVLAAIAFGSTTTLVADAEAVRLAEAVLRELEALRAAITDAETAERGYAITGDEAFLAPLDEGAPAIASGIARLRELLTAPDLRGELEDLVVVLNERLALVRHGVERRRTEGFGAAQAMVASGEGRQLHDRIRAVMDRLRREQEAILQVRGAGRREAARITMSAARFGAALAVVGLAAALVVVRSELGRRRRAEVRLRETAGALAVARDRAEAADRLTSAVLATMSRELRPPLNSILGLTGGLLRRVPGPLTEEQARQLAMVQESARRLLDVVNDEPAIPRFDPGERHRWPEPFEATAGPAPRRDEGPRPGEPG